MRVRFFLAHPERGYSVNWHVPIDDTHHWKFWWSFSRERAIDRDDFRRGRLEMTADFKPTRNRANRYLQDRASMETESYTGIGNVFQAQDMCVTEGAGPTQDRSQEHLTGNDAPMVMARKLLLKGLKDIEAGKDPPGVTRDPSRNRFPKAFAYDTLAPADVDWPVYIRQIEAEVESQSERSPLTAAPVRV